LIVDEPTRGVDVGAKAAIHGLIDELARQGLGVLLISSELPEVMNLSTRILVMRDGRLVGEVRREEATQAGLMRLMAGVEQTGGLAATVSDG
jgi:ABC-type sugar transport system ATPase subunit